MFQVVVTVNGYTAACLGDCSFTYDDTVAPFLSSVSGIVGKSSVPSCLAVQVKNLLVAVG